jgi:hypothetical protein
MPNASGSAFERTSKFAQVETHPMQPQTMACRKCRIRQIRSRRKLALSGGLAISRAATANKLLVSEE